MGGDGYPPEDCLLDRLVRVFEEQGYPHSPAHRAAYWGATHHGAEGPLICLRQVPVPSDVDADVRLGQQEVGATGLARLHVPEVARLDIVATGRRGMLWQEPQVPLEMGPPLGVVPYPVAMARGPLAAKLQGVQCLPGVEERLAVQRDF